MTGGTLTITVRNGVTVIYSKVLPLVDGTPVTTWWEYFFASIDQKTDVVLTDIPTLGTSTVQVELTATAGTVSMGSLVFGSARELGDAERRGDRHQRLLAQRIRPGARHHAARAARI